MSMNLVDVEVTGIRAAFDAVAERGAGHGLGSWIPRSWGSCRRPPLPMETSSTFV